MSLLETIKKDMIEASKKGDVDSTNILKLAIASIKNEEIAKGSKLSDEEILKVLRKEESKIKDSIAEFTKMGREDLIERESKQLKVISSYLPKLMSREEIEKVVSKIVADTHAEGLKSMGAVMSVVMKELQGKADGSTVKEVVQEFLSK
ncbi:MAG TPA: GatB/YqeY domain-containing protein [Candidatus Dojkabacteria bacterium]|nr:GatB/YqeY domain-containing protein [Candidatus Dojkabacteria bacterium]HQA87491.1 GatB/YqeY domain-containing protein [Candidatus Dojkabacteria bacterium]